MHAALLRCVTLWTWLCLLLFYFASFHLFIWWLAHAMKPASNKRKVKYWLFHSSDILSPHVSSDTLPHLWIHTNRGHPTRLRLCNPVFLSLRLVNWSWSKGWEVLPTPSNRLLHFPYCPLTTVSLILFTSGHRPTKHGQISSITELLLK